MLDVVIIGAGGFGREVYRWAQDALNPADYRIKGFLSRRMDELDGFGLNEPILGDDQTYDPQDNDRFVCAVGDVEVKKRIVETWKPRNAQFLTIIHPTAVVASSARVGEGVILCPFALISERVILGNFVTLNFYSSCGHDTSVGDYSTFSPYATANGFVTIEPEVFMGTHASVIAYRKVGAGAKISANSVAMHDVPRHSLVLGVPGKIRTIFS